MQSSILAACEDFGTTTQQEIWRGDIGGSDR